MLKSFLMFRKNLPVWLVILVFSLIYSTFAVFRHLRLETDLFDLGYYDQLLWLAAHGRPLYSSLIQTVPWVDHLSLTIYLLAPLYWLWESPLVLLIFQAVFISLGAWPIYLLARQKTRFVWFPLVLVFAYLFFYGLQNAIAYDFHPLALGSALLAWSFWFYEKGHFKLFWLSLILLVGLQENFWFLASALGVFLIVNNQDRRRGLILFIGSLILGVFAILVLIPRVTGQPYYYLPDQAIWPLNDLAAKIEVAAFALIAFGFLPLLAPAYFLLLAEEFAGRFLLTNNPNWWSLGYHYNAILTPILALATIKATEKYGPKKEWLITFLILTGTLITWFMVKPDVFRRLASPAFYNLNPTLTAKKLLKLIPPEASVAASNNLGAQIAHREKISFLTNCYNYPVPRQPSDRRCLEPAADYLIADLNPQGNSNNYDAHDNQESISGYFTYLLNTGHYILLTKDQEVYLLEKVARSR
jgi:uncharacterized membrane protein